MSEAEHKILPQNIQVSFPKYQFLAQHWNEQLFKLYFHTIQFDLYHSNIRNMLIHMSSTSCILHNVQ